LRSAHKFSVHTAAPAALAGAVLNRLDLHVVPVFPEGREHAAVMRHIAVPVGGTFPDAHGGKMRRLQRCDLPLVDAVIRNSVEPDFSVRPRLHACPLDAVVEIFRLAWGEMIDEARRASGAARVDANANVVVRYP